MGKDYWKWLDQSYVQGEIIDVIESDSPYEVGYSFSAIVLKNFNGDTILNSTKFEGIDCSKYNQGDIFKWLVDEGYVEEIESNRTLYISPKFSEK